MVGDCPLGCVWAMECKHHMIVILFQKDLLGWWQLWGASLSSIILTRVMTQQTRV